MRRQDDLYEPKPEHKFSFGPWTVGNRGRDPFGDFVRSAISPVEIVDLLAEVGAWKVNLHDNDLVPIDATCAERHAIVRNFKRACKESGLVVPMATVSLFFHPVFRDGAFTANDPEVPTPCKKRCARWISGRSWGRRFSSCGVGARALRPTLVGVRTKP